MLREQNFSAIFETLSSNSSKKVQSKGSLLVIVLENMVCLSKVRAPGGGSTVGKTQNV